MLSRIAESLFWIGRYVERAEGTARLLDVHLQMLVEDPWVEEETACAHPARASWAAATSSSPTGPAWCRLLAYDESSPWSIARCLSGARENARRARETLSTELWEVLNTTWNTLPSGRWRASRDAIFFRWVRERTSLVAGVADGTMSRDEGWHFLVLGRSLERADMTARLVASTVVSRGPTAAWPTLLLACGAREVFLRTYRGMEADRDAAEFILLDRLFPRSIVHALGQAEESLEQIAGLEQRIGVHDEALRVLGAARAGLEYTPLSDVVTRLPDADGGRAAGLLVGERRDRPALLRGCDRDVLGRGEPVSARVEIVHRTGFRYDEPVMASYNEARMTPMTTPSQQTLRARIEVRPTSWETTYVDYWGTQVTAFEVLRPHDQLEVTARSVVELDDVAAFPGAADLLGLDVGRLGWADLGSPGSTTSTSRCC